MKLINKALFVGISLLLLVFCSGHNTRGGALNDPLLHSEESGNTPSLQLVRKSRGQLPRLESFGGTPLTHKFPLQLCQGDCDNSNDDCAEGLVCFQRGRGGVEVPGCRGGSNDLSKTDYCILAELAGYPSTPNPTLQATTKQPTPHPTPGPSAQPTPSPTNEPTPQPTLVNSPEPTSPGAMCIDNAKCAALGLNGLCCPTEHGVTLDCCVEPESTMTSCTNNPVCAGLSLIGNCCPSDDGVQLDCCESN